MDNSVQTSLNNAQLEILQLFSQGLTELELEELRATLIEFRTKQLEKQVLRVANNKGLSIEDVNEAYKQHRRKAI